jgi:AcrR family transcriptional regulator
VRGAEAKAEQGDTDANARRTYRSPLRAQRAQQTRAALMEAATRLFTAHGWSATGMRDIAREAGVATETLYSHFASKAGLLRAVTDAAVVGDEAPLAVAERPEFSALGEGARAERIAAAARLVTAIHARTAGFAKVIREAASTDEAMADELHGTRERQRMDVERGLALLIDREPTTPERDGLWALLSPDVYLLLVEESGWTIEQYEVWLAETLERVIPRA